MKTLLKTFISLYLNISLCTTLVVSICINYKRYNRDKHIKHNELYSLHITDNALSRNILINAIVIEA